MNIERERKLFEEWAYSKNWNINRCIDMGLDYYVDDFVDGAWHGWLASVNREGFVLVPAEATRNMLDAFPEVIYQDTYAGECSIWVDDLTLSKGYKAMIEASQENV